MNKLYDCHYHFYGDSIERLKDIVYQSEYYNKYMCYHYIDFNKLKNEPQIDTNCIYFMIPFVIKEIDIHSANQRLKAFSNQKKNIMQFPLLEDNSSYYF